MSDRFAFHELLLQHARETADVYVVETGSATDPPGALHVFARTHRWRYDPAGVAYALGRRRDPAGGGGTRPLDRASAAEAARALGAELPDDDELARLMAAGRAAEEAARAARMAAPQRATPPRPAPTPPAEPTWWVQLDLDGQPVGLLLHQDPAHGLRFDPGTRRWTADPREVWTRIHDVAERATGLVREVPVASAESYLARWEVELPTDGEVRAALRGQAELAVRDRPRPQHRPSPLWWVLSDGDTDDDLATVAVTVRGMGGPLRAALLRHGSWQPVPAGLGAELVADGRPTGRALRECSWERARRVAALAGTDLVRPDDVDQLLGPEPASSSWYEVRSPETGALLTVLLSHGWLRTVVLRPDRGRWEADSAHGIERLAEAELLAGHTVPVDGEGVGRALDELGQPWPTDEQTGDLARGRRDELPAAVHPVAEDLDLAYAVHQQVTGGVTARVRPGPGMVHVRSRSGPAASVFFHHIAQAWTATPGSAPGGLEPEDDLLGRRTVGRRTAEWVAAASGLVLPPVAELRALLGLPQ